MNRVVVTGMGAVTPIGNNVNEFWNSIKSGKVGFAPISGFDTEEYSAKLAAEVKDFNPTDYMDRKAARRMDRFSQLAVTAANEAAADAAIDISQENPYRLSVIVGSGVGSLMGIEREYEKLLTKGPRKINPLTAPLVLGNMAAANIAIQLGFKGKCLDTVTACATGSNSIGEAFRSIKYGECDIAAAGGVDSSVSRLGVAAFQSLTALTPSTDPLRASIPFDKERNGFVTGEGAGVLILESLDHAQRRGAKIYAEIVGYGATCDANHITTPMADGSGMAEAIRLTLQEAEISPEDVDYVNAHGTSTVYNDLYETIAIKRAFGKTAYKLKINSTKSMTGHLFGASGAVELITCIKSINEGYIHPTVGLKVDDPECDLDYTKGDGVHMPVNIAISNSLGFGGHNAAIAVRKF